MTTEAKEQQKEAWRALGVGAATLAEELTVREAFALGSEVSGEDAARNSDKLFD